MASCSSFFSEQQFLCPICLDVFTQPVSTPCGHNFCMSCITTFWDDKPVCECPYCKEAFEKRPDLKVNTFISELASQFLSLQVTEAQARSPEEQQAGCGDMVPCDICTDSKQEAVKSCLKCLMSYCSVHLEPHQRATALRSHTLVDPLASLEDRICKEHARLLMSFCRNDKVLLCDVCAGSHHAKHDIIPVQQAYTEMKVLLWKTETQVQQMIQERLKKVQAMKESVKQSEQETKDAIANSVQDLATLVSEIQKSQIELVKVLEEKQRAAEDHADGFVCSMKQEIAKLQITTLKLEELKQTEDKFCFLQSFPNQFLLPHTMDLSTFSLNRHEKIRDIRKSISKSASQLRTLLSEMNTEIKLFSEGKDVANDRMLRYMRQYEVDIVLDPDTAHPLLILSEDRKQVRFSMGSVFWRNQILNPKTFTTHLAVLGERGFNSYKFYFEVFVGEKTEWCLGMATASIQRSRALSRSSDVGLWAIWFLQDKFETYCSPNVPVYHGKVKRVGVFVNFDAGQISFYDVQTATPIYSFTGCVFREELYPYFNPCDNEYGSNLDPMIIVPVGHTE